MTATSEKMMQPNEWHHLPASKVAQHLDTNLQTGLTSDEVVKRRERFGANELQAKSGTNPILRFLLQFNQPLLYILLVAGAIKALIGQWVSAWVIWGVTLIKVWA